MSWSRRLGPRTRFSAFGALSPAQTRVAAVGAVGALGVLVLGGSSWWALPASMLAAVLVAASVLGRRWGLPVADWALKAAAYGASPKAWQARPVGVALPTDEQPEVEVEQLPRELAGVRVATVRDHDRTLGMLEDRDTLTAVSRVELHPLGLLDEGEQTRRMEAFARVLDDLASFSDRRYRVSFLARHIPRGANQERAYIEEHVEDLDSPQARSLLSVVGGEETGHEDELYVCMRRSRGDGSQAAAWLMDRLGHLVDRLAEADIAVRTPGGLLGPREVARLVKDSYDPFGRALRDELERATGLAGVDPRAAWPDATYRHVDAYETDGALHATYWIRGWPPTDVGPGWMRSLTIRCDVPAMTIATVLAPEGREQAINQVRRAQSRSLGALSFRRRAGQVDKVEHGARAEYLSRQEHFIGREGASPWWWETYVTVSAPDRTELERSMRKVESACVECSLRPVLLRFAQAEAFTFSLPLGRGLEPERPRL